MISDPMGVLGAGYKMHPNTKEPTELASRGGARAMKECELESLAKTLGQAFKSGAKPPNKMLRASSSTNFVEVPDSSTSSSGPPVTVAEVFRRAKKEAAGPGVRVSHSKHFSIFPPRKSFARRWKEAFPSGKKGFCWHRWYWCKQF